MPASASAKERAPSTRTVTTRCTPSTSTPTGDGTTGGAGPAAPAPEPVAAAPVVEDLLETIRHEALDARIAPRRIDRVRYSGGSDHALWIDPAMGVPCPMLIEWPDRWYHSDLDTPDRCDPESLAHAARTAATYALTLATAGAEDVHALARLVTQAARRRLRLAVEGTSPRLQARAEHVRGQRLVRIEALALLDEPDALQLEVANPTRLVRRHLSFDVDERLAALNPIGQLRRAVGPAIGQRTAEGARRRRQRQRCRDRRRAGEHKLWQRQRGQ